MECFKNVKAGLDKNSALVTQKLVSSLRWLVLVSIKKTAKISVFFKVVNLLDLTYLKKTKNVAEIHSTVV